MEFIKNHPIIWTVFCFLFGAIPQWVGAVWSLFSSEPLAQFISRNGMGIGMPGFSPFWITIPLGLFMFGVLIWQLRNWHQYSPLKSAISTKNNDDASSSTKSMAPIIEFSKEHAISKDQDEGIGIKRGPWYTSRIKIVNKSSNALLNTRVSIVSLLNHDEKFPEDLLGKVNIPFSLPFSSHIEESIILNPIEEKFVDIFHYHQIFWNCNIRLGKKNGPEIYGGPYAIEIQATSQSGYSGKAEFIIGLCRKEVGGSSDPYFEPIFIPGMTLEQMRDQLIALCANGVHLREEIIPTGGMLNIWQERYDIWHLQILQTANRFDRDLRHKLWPLNTMQSWNLGNPISGEHQQALNIISEVISRVRRHLGIDS